MSNFNYYPNIDNKNFFEKISLKKEFLNTKIKPVGDETMEEACQSSIGFYLLNQQIFLKEYLSLNTPYNGMLLFHGVGVGKTCAAITIAENFKDFVHKTGKKIIILVSPNIRDNFYEKLFDIDKDNRELEKMGIKTQCTGYTYSLPKEFDFLSRKDKLRKIRKEINKYYEFRGYEEFVNKVRKNSGWKSGKKDDLTPEIIEKIQKIYSERVIIIDEVHNVKKSGNKDKKVPPVLEAVINYGQNNKLVLMSATPMYDSPTEIIFLLNLLLRNDNKPTISKSDIFDVNNNITSKGSKVLAEKCRGYISYLRGERPPRFPVRIYPSEATTPKIKYDINNEIIPQDKSLRYIPLYLCNMSKNQFDYYQEILSLDNGNNNNNNNNNENGNSSNINENNLFQNEKKRMNIAHKLLYASSIVYPSKNGFSTNLKGRKNPKTKKYKKGQGAFVEKENKSKLKYYEPTKYALIGKDKKLFLDESILANYSTKYSAVLENIKKSNGIVFVYSENLSVGGGIVPFALMLEQNGYDRFTVSGEPQLLNYPGKKGDRVDYRTGLPPSASVHRNTKNKNYSSWNGGKYILLSGSKSFSKINVKDAVKIINDKKNAYGKNIKIILGNRVAGEGIDFSKIRQVHILEPWYNMSRLEQIIGRAIRTCSHVALKPEERNVEIFFYASIPPSKSSKKTMETETIDIRRYRISITKDIKIKKVERILKENAVDCFLNKEANYIKPGKVIDIITSSGRKMKYEYGDKPGTRECDYLDDCNYKCCYEPSKEIINKIVNTDTYNTKILDIDIDKIKNQIYKLFKKNYIYSTDDLVSLIKKKIEADDVLIFRALDEIVYTSNSKQKVILLDKFKRKGYIIYKNGYYIYQPNELEDTRANVERRKKPLKIKSNSIIISNEYLQNFNDVEEIKIDVLDKIKNDKDELSFYLSQFNKKINEKIIYSLLLDKLDNIFKEKLLQEIVIGKTKINKIIIKYFKENLITEKRKYIGYELNGNFKCYIRGKFKQCPLNIEQKFRDAKIRIKNSVKDDKRKLNPVHGLLTLNKSNNYVFKIVDTLKEKTVIKSNTQLSKRSISKGCVCTSYNQKKLIKIMKYLNNKFKIANLKKPILCLIIEYTLREYETKKKDNFKWFIKVE